MPDRTTAPARVAGTARTPARTTATRAPAVRASLSPLGSPRAAALLDELAARGAAVPAPLRDRDAAHVGVLVTLHDVETGAAAAGGATTVRDDATVEVLGPWSADPTWSGLARRVLWELEAEARRRGFTHAVVPGAVAAEQADALREGGYTATVHDADGTPALGKRLTR